MLMFHRNNYVHNQFSLLDTWINTEHRVHLMLSLVLQMFGYKQKYYTIKNFAGGKVRGSWK